MKRRKKKQGGAFGKATSSRKTDVRDLIQRTLYGYWCMTLTGDTAGASEMMTLLSSGCRKIGLEVDVSWRGRLLDYAARIQNGETLFSGTFEEASQEKPPGCITSIRPSVSKGIPSDMIQQGLN